MQKNMTHKNLRLRLESEDGSAGREYRVNDNKVEVRSLRSRIACDLRESNWHRLSPQQLRSHIERNTVVARWLELRLGWRRLLQVCASPEMHVWRTTENLVDTHVA